MTATTSGGSSILTELGTPGAVQSEPAALAPAANGTGGNGQTPAQAAADKAWWAEYEAEFKEDPGFSKIKSYENPKGVVKAYMNLEKLLGGEKVPKPRADDDVDLEVGVVNGGGYFASLKLVHMFHNFDMPF